MLPRPVTLVREMSYIPMSMVALFNPMPDYIP